MSLHKVPWACMQFHELACSFMTLYAVAVFVWAAHKNFAVLVRLGLTLESGFGACWDRGLGTWTWAWQFFQIGYSTWESSLTIESVLNTHYNTYQCIASNSLGEDSLNISLHHKTIPDPPVNLEVTMKDYKTVQLKVNKNLYKLLTNFNALFCVSWAWIRAEMVS